MDDIYGGFNLYYMMTKNITKKKEEEKNEGKTHFITSPSLSHIL